MGVRTRQGSCLHCSISQPQVTPGKPLPHFPGLQILPVTRWKAFLPSSPLTPPCALDHVSMCQFQYSTWMHNEHLKPNMESRMLHAYPLPSTPSELTPPQAFPISANGIATFPVIPKPGCHLHFLLLHIHLQALSLYLQSIHGICPLFSSPWHCPGPSHHHVLPEQHNSLLMGISASSLALL